VSGFADWRLDLLTHATVGALLAEALLGRRLGNRALGWGAFIGVLPDLDLLFSPFLSNAGGLFLRNGPSHALVVVVVASVLISRWLAKLWKKDRIPRARIGFFVFAVLATHVLLDSLTVRGAAVLWPFVPERLALGSLPLFDPLLVGPPLVALVWLVFQKTKKQQAKRRRLGAWGLGIGSGYIALSLLAQRTAAAGFQADLDRREVTSARSLIAPTPMNLLYWRALVEHGDDLWVGYRPVFQRRSEPVTWTVIPRRSEAFAVVEDLSEARTIDRVCGGWWIVRPHRRGVWIADLRFDESREWAGKKGALDLRAAIAWVLEPEPALGGERLRRIHPPASTAADGTAADGPPAFATVRLAGIHGSLPEVLGVVE
jgi:inner membrane protein